MLLNYTELGLLWEAMPPKIKQLIDLRAPSFLRFYSVAEPVLEFVWCYQRHYFMEGYTDSEGIEVFPDSEGYKQTRFSVAWFIGDNYRLDYRSARRHIKVHPRPSIETKDPTEMPSGACKWSIAYYTHNDIRKLVPFDRESACESLRLAWDYLSRTDQLGALFW